MTTERKKPLPYYRWYVRDHRAHRICRTLSCFEEGMLRKLLDEQWEEGCIPSDPGRLAELLGEPIGVVTEAWQKLRRLFVDMPGEDGFYVRNLRLEKERTEADALRVIKSLAGKKGGRPRKRDQDPQGDLMLEGMNGNSFHGAEIAKQAKAPESSGKHAAQESSSSSREEKSRRDGACPRCGQVGAHASGCIVGHFANLGAGALGDPDLHPVQSAPLA